MIGFIKAMAEAYGWGWTTVLLIYFTASAIVALLVSIDIIFGGHA